jgi:hypothetical protein
MTRDAKGNGSRLERKMIGDMRRNDDGHEGKGYMTRGERNKGIMIIAIKIRELVKEVREIVTGKRAKRKEVLILKGKEEPQEHEGKNSYNMKKMVTMKYS